MLKNFFIYSASKIVPAAMSLIFTFACVQLLSSEEYGELTLTLLPIMIAGAFAGGFASQPMLRFGLELTIKQRGAGLKEIPIYASLITLPFLVGYLSWSNKGAIAIVVGIFMVPLIAILDTHRSYLIASSQSMLIFYVDGIRSILGLTLLGVLLLFGVKENIAPLFALLLAIACAILFLAINFTSSNNAGSKSIDYSYVNYGLWLSLWLAVIGLMPFSERLLLKMNYGLSVVGEYSSIADPLSAVMSAIGAILVNTMMPKYILAWNEKRQKFLNRLMFISVLAISVGVLLCIVIGLILSMSGLGRISEIINSNSMIAATLAVATGVWQMGIIFHKPLEMRNETQFMFLALLISVLMFLIVSILLMPVLGMMGVVVSKLMAGFLYIGIVVNFNLKLSIDK